jgi:hypothetical protein
MARQSASSDPDTAARPSSVEREEGGAKDEAHSDFQEEVRDHEAGARPMSEVTGGPQGGTPDEDKDGLDEVARALREAAEAPIGRRELGR